MKYQYCCICDDRTGRCNEDSMYVGDVGPLCEECYKKRNKPMLKLLEGIVTIYGDILENEPELVQVEAPQFNEDFGTWKAGEHVHMLALEVIDDDVYLREYTEDNKVKREVKVQLGIRP